MRVLVVGSRYPMAGGKGDQLRPFAFMRRLADRHDFTVVTGAPAPSPEEQAALEAFARVDVVPAGRVERVRGALGAAARGRPAQAGWSLPPAVQARARQLAPRHDVALVVTARSALPLPIPFVLDHIDALSLNMRQRAQGPEPLPIRAVAAVEARLMRRWERRVAPHAAAQVVISEVDAAAPDGRDIDVIFTGNMTYPPNVEAVAFLADELAPRIRAQLPGARILVVGRNADRVARRGIEIASDVPDLGAYLRRARVALVPLLSGTGQPTKVLEAAASGAAVVATAWVGTRFPFGLVTAEGPDDLAAATVELLRDETRRRAQADVALAAMRAASPDEVAARLERVLADCARSPYVM